jgi:hypothetical protein
LRRRGVDLGDDLEAAIAMLDDRGAALDPIAAVEIPHAEPVVDRVLVQLSLAQR